MTTVIPPSLTWYQLRMLARHDIELNPFEAKNWINKIERKEREAKEAWKRWWKMIESGKVPEKVLEKQFDLAMDLQEYEHEVVAPEMYRKKVEKGWQLELDL